MKRRYLQMTGMPLVICSLWIAACGVYAAGSNEYIQPPVTLSASNVLPKDLLQGDNYTVKDQVTNDGLINTYSLATHYGSLTVESTSELRIRIAELKALQIMEEMDRKKVFGDALVEGAKGTVKGAVELVKSPIETGKKMIAGTGQFFSNIGDSILSDDPDQDNVVKVALGYDVAKRQFAFEFGIDPYTDYDPVADRLGEIARAAVAGGITPRAALATVNTTVTLGLGMSGTAYSMLQLVRDNPPGKLKEINRGKLKKMGIDDALIDVFLENYRYNPQEETLLVGALELMKGVAGREVFISRANLATEETVALSFRIRAQMMADYHVNVAPVAQIKAISGILTLQRKDGAVVVLAPADNVFWTKRLEDRIIAFEKAIEKVDGISGKALWISGRFDEKTRAGFEGRGWQIQENAQDVLLKNRE